MIPLLPVTSSAIRKVGYEGSTLAVLFHSSDTIYQHPHVPLAVFLGLMAAASKGSYYARFIRGRYR